MNTAFFFFSPKKRPVSRRSSHQHPQSSQAVALRAAAALPWAAAGAQRRCREPGRGTPRNRLLFLTQVIMVGCSHGGTPSNFHPQQTQVFSAGYFCFPQVFSFSWYKIRAINGGGWIPSGCERLSLHRSPKEMLPFSPTQHGITAWPLSRGASKLVFPFC